jgi:hypothetical protein
MPDALIADEKIKVSPPRCQKGQSSPREWSDARVDEGTRLETG